MITDIRARMFVLLTALFVFTGVGTARAACTSPTAAEGEIVYNADFKVMQYCSGTTWVGMAGQAMPSCSDNETLSYSSATGWGCAAPAAETDPQVGAVTNAKWCRGSGSAVECDQNAPSGIGGVVDTQTFNSSGTWTKPGSGSLAKLECWGGGGGGGGNVGSKGGGGGGGGSYVTKIVPLATMGATESVTIGSGGTAGPSGGASPGGDGGTSSIGSLISANGGYGGQGGAPNNGQGGFAGYSDSGGLGGNGLSDGFSSFCGGGGGGGGNGTGVGSAFAGGTSGCGGNGGAGGYQSNGSAGTAPGGGGGGGGHGTGSRAGGAGAAGRCKVTVF